MAWGLQAVEVGDGAQDGQGGGDAGDVADDDAAASVLLAQLATLGVLLHVVEQASEGG